jgi:urease gamma subunit
MNVEDKLLRAKARQLLKEYGDVIEYAAREIQKEVAQDRIVGETAFEYAKKVIRKEAILEGVALMQRKINKYAE